VDRNPDISSQRPQSKKFLMKKYSELCVLLCGEEESELGVSVVKIASSTL
jgi:hypothetical protein